MKYKVSRPEGSIELNLTLPASKSISNRLLIIHALSGNTLPIENFSSSDDSLLMQKAIVSAGEVKDIGHAGTAMRFLTAYYSCRSGQITLTGSERMKERPIGPLVDALRELGAEISYAEKEGYPPLQISGRKLAGGKLAIDGSISSQFISALLMIAPSMVNGLELELRGSLVSASYIKMTLALMKEFGADYTWTNNIIRIDPGVYRKGAYRVESDWSAASYWYAMALLDDHGALSLKYLSYPSLQGDSALRDIFTDLGVLSDFNQEMLSLKKKLKAKPVKFTYDFTNAPDIVQTMAVSLCMQGILFHFTGTQTLRIKETDRIAALQTELAKLGFVLESDAAGSYLSWEGKRCMADEKALIFTYHDHRMAMAFAPAALVLGSIRIDDPLVVTKSYPRFWEDMRSAGFDVELIK